MRERFGARIPTLELIVGDMQSGAVRFAPVELIFAGLLLVFFWQAYVI